MQVIALRTLRKFWEMHPQSETSLRTWYATAAAAAWESPQDIKNDFGTTVDFVGGQSRCLRYRGQQISPDCPCVLSIQTRAREIRWNTRGIRQDQSGEGEMNDIRPLRGEADYDAALEAIETYFDSEPEPGSPRPTASICWPWSSPITRPGIGPSKRRTPPTFCATRWSEGASSRPTWPP